MLVGNKIVWEHLENDSLDERYKIVAEALEEGLTYLDINCGIGGFANYAKKPKWYYGNDKEREYISKCPKHKFCKFEILEDTYLTNRLEGEKFDVICLFGATIGYPPESEYEESMYYDLIKQFKPKYVVWEGVRAYEKLYEKPRGYKVKESHELNFGKDAHLKRKVIIYENKR